MTIKRRLFISNIFMLIIPVLLSLLVIGTFSFLLLHATAFSDNYKFYPAGQFFQAVEKMDELAWAIADASEPQSIKHIADEFLTEYDNLSITLSIYQGERLVYPETSALSAPLRDYILSLEEGGAVMVDDTTLCRSDAGDYHVLIATDQMGLQRFYGYDHGHSAFNIGLLMMLLVAFIIILTNRYLTRIVFNSIMLPLNNLVYGVHQIRDGNLDYRIHYQGQDEFAEVCADFNEMAQRLLDSVNARQKDEANRRELIAGISHDLRTPLTSIKAYAEGIEQGVASTPLMRTQYLETIKHKTADLERIVNQLFLFSKLDIGDFPLDLEVLDIIQTVDRLAAELSMEYEGKGLSVCVVGNYAESLLVLADAVQMRNALTNIIENSLKYKIKEQGLLQIGVKADDDWIYLELVDDGPGVAEELLEKLFEVFYRTDASRSNTSDGSGLGLAITAKILELQGGSIRAENAAGSGLAIIIILPRWKGVKQHEAHIDH